MKNASSIAWLKDPSNERWALLISFTLETPTMSITILTRVPFPAPSSDIIMSHALGLRDGWCIICAMKSSIKVATSPMLSAKTRTNLRNTATWSDCGFAVDTSHASHGIGFQRLYTVGGHSDVLGYISAFSKDLMLGSRHNVSGKDLACHSLWPRMHFALSPLYLSPSCLPDSVTVDPSERSTTYSEPTRHTLSRYSSASLLYGNLRLSSEYLRHVLCRFIDQPMVIPYLSNKACSRAGQMVSSRAFDWGGCLSHSG